VSSPPARPPNILWIVTTQWRAQACGYAGDINARTPVLDALAARSVNYVQAITPHPFGPFARAALLTGTPSPRNGVRDYFDPLPTDALTIAHLLSSRGYATAWFGKWHLWRRDPEASLVGDAHARIVVPPEARGGFEFWEGFESGFQLNDPWLHGSWVPEPARFIGYQPDVLAERLGMWWDSGETGGRPWFCVVSTETPHPPYDEPAGIFPPISPEDVKPRANVAAGSAEQQARCELGGYYAHISATDAAIGRILAALRSAPDGDNTVVVVTSVHGDMHGSHGVFRKGWPHEESVRVPLLVRTPWSDQGVRSEEPVSLLDLVPMTEAWADGRSWSCPRDHAILSMPSVVQFPHQCDRLWRGVRTRSWKVVFRDDGSPWLVFDLGRDPLEMRNLIRDAAAGPILAAAYSIDLGDWMLQKRTQPLR
jgi:arylsulfatase A-like enzyme